MVCRFTPEERAKRPQHCYLPFGTGPRTCIAMRFALLEAKAALIQVLKRFTFVRAPDTEVSSYSGTSECGHALGPSILSFVERLSSFRGYFVQSLYKRRYIWFLLCLEVCPLSECPLSEFSLYHYLHIIIHYATCVQVPLETVLGFSVTPKVIARDPKQSLS